MAKPVAIPPWATNAVYAGGPFVGQPTKVAVPAGVIADGWQPDQKPPAEYQNQWQSDVAAWLQWVLDGSSSGGLTAHIVETNGSGVASIARAVLGGTTLAAPALTATSNTGGAAAIVGEDTTGALGVQGIGSGASAGVRGENTGTGCAVEGVALGTDNDGVRGTGTGAGDGGLFIGGATGAGIVAQGGASGGIGTLGASGALGAGVNGTGVNSAGAQGGVRGSALHVSAYGVEGFSAASGDAAAAGTYGRGFSDAVGVYGQSSDGYGVVAESDQTGPNRSAARLVPQDAAPVTALSGDVYYSDELAATSGLAHDELRVRSRAGWRSLMMRTDGFIHNFDANAGTQVSGPTAGVFLNLETVTIAAPNEARRTGDVIIRISGEAGANGSTAAGIDVRVRDTTAGTTLFTRSITFHHTASAFERHFYVAFRYTLPLDGNRTWVLEFATQTTGQTVQVRDAHLEIEGVF